MSSEGAIRRSADQMPSDSSHNGDCTVHVIDDDEPVRRGIALLLRAAGILVQTHASGLDFLAAFPEGGETAAGCVLTDVCMAGLDGLELLRRLRERGFEKPIIVMTAYGDIPTAVRAMKAGASDFVEKPFRGAALLAAIRAAFHQETRPFVSGRALEADVTTEAAARVGVLSPREREVLGLLTEGKSNKAIAQELGLSPRTVEIHRARMMSRLQVGSLAEAVRLALRAEVSPKRGMNSDKK